MSTVATLVKNIIVKITNPFLQCSPSVTVVKVENHLGKNSVQNLQLGYTIIIKQ